MGTSSPVVPTPPIMSSTPRWCHLIVHLCSLVHCCQADEGRRTPSRRGFQLLGWLNTQTKDPSQSFPRLVFRIQCWTKEKCFTRRTGILPWMRLLRKILSSSLVPAHAPSRLAPARYVNRYHLQTRTSLRQMMHRFFSPLMTIARMTLWVIMILFFNAHLASYSLKLRGLCGTMFVLPAQLCSDPNARYATVNLTTAYHFRNTWKVLSSHVSFV